MVGVMVVGVMVVLVAMDAMMASLDCHCAHHLGLRAATVSGGMLGGFLLAHHVSNHSCRLCGLGGSGGGADEHGPGRFETWSVSWSVVVITYVCIIISIPDKKKVKKGETMRYIWLGGYRKGNIRVNSNFDSDQKQHTELRL